MRKWLTSNTQCSILHDNTNITTVFSELSLPRKFKTVLISTVEDIYIVILNDSISGPQSEVSYLAEKLSTDGYYFYDRVHSYSKTNPTGNFGGTMFQYYHNDQGLLLNLQRSISKIFDGRRWVYDEHGDPKHFEPKSDSSRRKEFDLQYIEKIFSNLQVRLFDISFYADRSLVIFPL